MRKGRLALWPASVRNELHPAARYAVGTPTIPPLLRTLDQNGAVTRVYAEERGIWHIVEREEGDTVVTLCGEQLREASIHRLDFEPRPFCSRCRYRLAGL